MKTEKIFTALAIRRMEWLEAGEGEADYLTTEVGGRFTGNYIALYASGDGKDCRNAVRFDMFDYIGV